MGKPPHFHLFGVPVRVEPFFLVVIGMLGFVSELRWGVEFLLSWMIIATASVLMHEMGHALAFKAFGIQPSVVLYGLGGLTSGRGALKPSRSIVVSLAGPLSTLLLVGIPAVVLRGGIVLYEPLGAHFNARNIVLDQVIFVNVAWAILNLLPVLPLDGGNVTASALELFFKGSGRRIANVVSLVIAGAIALWAFSQPEYMFLGMIVGMLAVMNITELARGGSSSAGMNGQGVQLVEAQRALLAHQPVVAEQIARDVLAARPDPAVSQWAFELLGWARLFMGDVNAATQVVGLMAPAQPSQAFRGALALAQGDRQQGVAVLSWALANETNGPSTVLGAVATAKGSVVTEVAHELILLGGVRGRHAAMQFAQLLQYAGLTTQSGQVLAMLSAYTAPPVGVAPPAHPVTPVPPAMPPAPPRDPWAPPDPWSGR